MQNQTFSVKVYNGDKENAWWVRIVSCVDENSATLSNEDTKGWSYIQSEQEVNINVLLNHGTPQYELFVSTTNGTEGIKPEVNGIIFNKTHVYLQKSGLIDKTKTNGAPDINLNNNKSLVAVEISDGIKDKITFTTNKKKIYGGVGTIAFIFLILIIIIIALSARKCPNCESCGSNCDEEYPDDECNKICKDANGGRGSFICAVGVIQTPDEQTPDEQTPDEQTPDEQTPDEQTP